MFKGFSNSPKPIFTCVILFLLLFVGCRSADEKNDEFILNPALNKVFKYSMTKISLHGGESYSWSDTARIDFDMQKLVELDSISTFELTLNDFVWKKPPVKIKFVGAEIIETPESRRPFIIIDSIGFFIKGSKLEVVMNKAGSVLDVKGIDELLKAVAQSAQIEKGFLRKSLFDHISVEAITDLLNTIFSVLPGKSVHNSDKWYPGLTLITKAPIKVSNIFELERIADDTAFVEIHSLTSAQQSEGGTVYMKGEQKGNAMVSYSTGMPFRYETSTKSITTTTQNSRTVTEYLLLERK